MGMILLAIGLVLVVEGLVYALAPSLLERVLQELVKMPVETRRLMGLGALGAGIVLIWLAQTLAG